MKDKLYLYGYGMLWGDYLWGGDEEQYPEGDWEETGTIIVIEEDNG